MAASATVDLVLTMEAALFRQLEDAQPHVSGREGLGLVQLGQCESAT